MATRWADAELAAEARREFESRLFKDDIAVMDGTMSREHARNRREKMLAITIRLEQLAENVDAQRVLDAEPDVPRCPVCGAFEHKYCIPGRASACGSG